MPETLIPVSYDTSTLMIDLSVKVHDAAIIESIDNRFEILWRAIIDNNQFKIRVGLTEDTIDRLCQKSSLESWNSYGNHFLPRHVIFIKSNQSLCLEFPQRVKY